MSKLIAEAPQDVRPLPPNNLELKKFKSLVKSAYMQMQRARATYESHLEIMERAKPRPDFDHRGQYVRNVSTHADYSTWIVNAELELEELRTIHRLTTESFHSILNS